MCRRVSAVLGRALAAPGLAVLVDRRGRWLAFWLMFLVLMAPGILQMEFRTDYRGYLAADDPYLQNLLRVNDTFTSSDNVIFVLAPASGEIFSAEFLQQMVEMTDDAWKLPFSSRVDSLSNYQHSRSEDDEITVSDLVTDPLAMTGAELAALRATALANEELVGRLLSRQGDVAAIAVTHILPGDDFSETFTAAEAARALAERFRQRYPDTRIYLTGMLMGNHAPLEIILDDNTTLVPIMFVVIGVMLTLLFRSLIATGITFVVVLLTLVSSLGLSGWLGATISGPSSMAPVIVLTIAVSDCVHILVSFLHHLQMGDQKRAAIMASIRENVAPVVLTSVTTFVGFITMNFSDVVPFQVLGNMVAAGVVIACVMSLTLMPALMYWMPIRRGSGDVSVHWMNRLSRHLAERSQVYLLVVALTTVLIASFIPRNEINDQFAKFFDVSREFRYSTDFADRHLSSVYDINVVLDSPYESGVYDVRYLARLEAFNTWLLQQPYVVSVQSVLNPIKQISQSLHGDDKAWYRLPDSTELAAQYFLLYEMNLPFGFSTTHLVSFDKQSSKVLVTLKELTTNQMLDVERDIHQWLQTEAPELATYSGSIMLMFSHLGVNNAISMLVGSLLVLTIMGFIAGVSLRSLRLGLVTVIAISVPVAMAFGLWGIFSGEVGLATAVAVSLTFGIVVDNAIHLLSKFRLRLLSSGDPKVALMSAYASVGLALVICNIVLILGFLILGFSDFKLSAELGVFTALTFSLGLLVNFLMVPGLLLRLFPGARIDEPRGEVSDLVVPDSGV